MIGSIDAITFDFHDTLARCDRWFELEVRELPSAFLTWYAQHSDARIDDADHYRAKMTYRKIREDVMGHGNEVDAETGVRMVLDDIGLSIDSETVRRGVDELMFDALDEASPVPGVVDAVTALRNRGVPLAVISSAVYHPFLEWTLDRFGIRDAFTTIVTSASSGYYKSRTEIYELTLRHLGAQPEQSVHVGDSCRFDVEVPARLGIRTVLFSDSEADCVSCSENITVPTLVDVDQLILNRFNGVV